MAHRVSLCSKGCCWMCSSAVPCPCIPPTPGEAQMEERPRWICADLSASWLQRRGCGCCWTVGGKETLCGQSQLLCVLWGTASCRHSPGWPSSVISLQLAEPGVLRLQGTAMGLHTQAGQGCSCGILSLVLYGSWIYGSWVSLYFHKFLCERVSFPLSCYITLG